MADQFLTTKEVGEHYGVTNKTVTRWCARGLFEGAFRAGRGRRAPWLIPLRDLEGFEPPQPGRPQEK